MRIARWAFTVFLITPLVAPLGTVSAMPRQQQDDSVAAAARRAQEKKAQQADSSKPTKVWDNDNLPDKPGAVNVVGQDRPPADSSAASGDNTGNPTPVDEKSAAADQAAAESDLASAKSKLADLKADLDVAQRKYAMDQQSYYGKTNYAADKDGATALSAEKSNVDAVAEAVAEAEKLLADAQAKVDAANQATAAAAREKTAQPAPTSQDNSAQTKTPPRRASTPNSDTATVNPN